MLSLTSLILQYIMLIYIKQIKMNIILYYIHNQHVAIKKYFQLYIIICKGVNLTK